MLKIPIEEAKLFFLEIFCFHNDLSPIKVIVKFPKSGAISGKPFEVNVKIKFRPEFTSTAQISMCNEKSRVFEREYPLPMPCIVPRASY